MRKFNYIFSANPPSVIPKFRLAQKLDDKTIKEINISDDLRNRISGMNITESIPLILAENSIEPLTEEELRYIEAQQAFWKGSI